MIKTTAIMVMFLLPFASPAQNKDLSALQKKYNNNSTFSLTATGNILRFLSDANENGNNPELKSFADRIRSLRILAVSKRSDGYSPRDIRKLKETIRKQSFEELMSVNSDNGQLKLLVRDRQGKPSELILIIDKDSEGFITLDLSENDFQ